jgi:hypothetical protein
MFALHPLDFVVVSILVAGAERTRPAHIVGNAPRTPHVARAARS